MTEEITTMQQVKALLHTVRFASMATVNEDGSPHNTPLLFIPDPAFRHFFWGSHPESLHSQNVLRTGQVFVVIYDSSKGGGIYMRADTGHPLDGIELDEALAVHNALRKRLGKDVLERKYYAGGSPQRMWSARITNIWVNGAERRGDGHLTRDFRKEITRDDLLAV